MNPVKTKAHTKPPTSDRTKAGHVFIGLQLPTTLAEVLKADAKKNYRNLSAHIRMILEIYYNSLEQEQNNEQNN
jgi:hypothetical protein